jgi:hypothetical protein
MSLPPRSTKANQLVALFRLVKPAPVFPFAIVRVVGTYADNESERLCTDKYRSAEVICDLSFDLIVIT